MANWYDYPQYFDLAFSDETAAEANFIQAACQRYATRKVKRLLEPGCGGGRLVVEMARRDFDLVTFDNNPRSVSYVQKRLTRAKLGGEVFTGDLTDFRVTHLVDAAFCTFNTFRHLTTEAAALAHLRSVAQAVRRGGIYILGFHLLPLDADEECIERWSAQRGQTKVVFTLRVLETNRRARLEKLRVTMLVRSPAKTLRLATEFPLRMYTAAQIRSLLRKVPEWELCDVFDFWYEIDEPLMLDDELSDTVFVLRRR
ncbi:MAG TPA: class I SAM-dependent methyltransferase [Pirellulaceae bacterium]|nr:class I SAM-dependent methyltransferase [Pirellulaceae bacterium]